MSHKKGLSEIRVTHIYLYIFSRERPGQTDHVQDAKTKGPDFPPLQPIRRRQSHPCKFTLIDKERSTILHVSNDCRLLTQMIQRIQLTRLLNSPSPFSFFFFFSLTSPETSSNEPAADQSPIKIHSPKFPCYFFQFKLFAN